MNKVKVFEQGKCNVTSGWMSKEDAWERMKALSNKKQKQYE